MNRNNLFGHLALAVAVIILAAFVGQMRHMQWRTHDTRVVRVETTQPAEPADDKEDGDEAADTNDQAENEDDAEVLVRFKPGTSAEAIARITAQLNDRVEDRFEQIYSEEMVIADEDNLDAEEVAAEYRALPEVLYAEPNSVIELEPGEDEVGGGPGLKPNYVANGEHAHPSDPMFDDQWSLDNHGTRGGTQGADISVIKAWEKTHGSEKIVVAVLDTGVDYTHRDLIKNIWTRPANMPAYTDKELGEFDDAHGFDASDMDGDPMDDNGHGTHCAGIVGAEGDNNDGIAGVNWRVEIMPLKFLGANGSGSVKDAIECINYAIARKQAGVNLRIISASWGSTMYSRALEDAIKRAGEEDILFVAAAGNSSTDNDRRPHYPSSYALPNVLSVAALTRRDELASFSNWGVKSVHVAAPGAEILSTWPNNQFEEHSGTSMATPEVSGVAALVLALSPHMPVKDLRARLISATDKLPALANKVTSGGRINAARAVKAE